MVNRNIINPEFNEMAVQLVMNQFPDSGNWWGVMFPLVKMGYDADGKSYPYVVTLDDQVLSAMPDGDSYGVSFFESRGSSIGNDHEDELSTHLLSVVFWLNITRLMAEKEDVFNQANSIGGFVIDTIYRIKMAGGFDIEVIEDPYTIMGKYTLFDAKAQTVSGRQQLFRIDFSMYDDWTCLKKIETK